MQNYAKDVVRPSAQECAQNPRATFYKNALGGEAVVLALPRKNQPEKISA